MENNISMYTLYKKDILEKILKYNDELHSLYENRNYSFINVMKYETEIKRKNINISYLEDIYKERCTRDIILKERNILENKELNTKLIKDILLIIYASKKINKLKNKIELLSIAYDLDELLYTKIINKINVEATKYLANHPLDDYRIGTNTGVFYLKRIISKNPKIDYKESMKLKKYLIENKIPLMNKGNPDGKPYWIYIYDYQFVKIVWNSIYSKFENIKCYKFEPSRSYSIYYKIVDQLEKKEINISDIDKNDKLHLHDRLLLYEKFDETYKLKIPHVNYKSKKQ